MTNYFDFVSDGRKPYDCGGSRHPLRSALAVAVPFRILELSRDGGPRAVDWDSLPAVAELISEHGDTLLYGGKKGEAARLFRGLVDALAVMAFGLGGVSVFGTHYEVKMEVE